MKKFMLICLTIAFLPFGLLYTVVAVSWDISKQMAEEVIYHKEIKARYKE